MLRSLLIPLLPLAGFVILSLRAASSATPRRLAGHGMVAASFVVDASSCSPAFSARARSPGSTPDISSPGSA